MTTPTITVTLHGETTTLPACTVADIVARVTGTDNPQGVAIAVNNHVVVRSTWDQPLADGDTIEVLTAVQGG
ncbi:sulfur carrier protein ThiS [Corynebacterium aquilae]|uniref:Thiamine biosynthesis protein ThiS n=1 Tax=Corynebacterium aquilae DSM 44791 TaxID=1431546 RepID=A0A1L7CD36_9CORY|nr:sulfur carrier protein ThiS [Corynebacterium aquilae]APT83770.1 hypothetical protein CAQU_00210 [Corynebacterium aquilae DSM 44791]